MPVRPILPDLRALAPAVGTVLAALVAAALSALAACPAAAGDRSWPVDPPPGLGRTVVRGFDPPAQRWLAGHRGVDLLGTAGGDVRAVRAGTVTFVGRVGGVPVVVVALDGPPDGLRLTFQPVLPSVLVGAPVAAGVPLGRLVDGAAEGAGHCPPGSCLHLGLKRGEAYLDPTLVLGGGVPRLLPSSTGPTTAASGGSSGAGAGALASGPGPPSGDGLVAAAAAAVSRALAPLARGP